MQRRAEAVELRRRVNAISFYIDFLPGPPVPTVLVCVDAWNDWAVYWGRGNEPAGWEMVHLNVA